MANKQAGAFIKSVGTTVPARNSKAEVESPTPPSDGQTVTLSDGSVWEYRIATPGTYFDGFPWQRKGSPPGFGFAAPAATVLLTAEDHRKIADVLDPPKSTHTATPSEVPRRNQMDHQWPVEQHIRDCVHHVESLTASPHLTEAVILLGKAREKVADFIENVPVIEQAAPSVSVEREALARTIAQNIDLDWGAHNLSDLTDEAHDNEEDACPACSKVADALLSRYSIQEKV